VVSWGLDQFGQLGNNTPFDGSSSDIPVQVSGLTNAIAVAAARDHSLALKSDGTVVAWGYDQFGQLGNGATTDGVFSDVPVAVAGLINVSEIAGGTSHSMARRSDGSVFTWGRDNTGQLGNGSANDGSSSNVPISVGTITNVVTIAAGGTHSLAARSATNLRGWGSTNYGQFGNNNVVPDDCDPGPDVILCANTPLPITSLSNLIAVAAGELHTVGLTSDGSVWAWGDDTAGQLGNGPSAPNECTSLATLCALSPVPVSGLSNMVAVAAGDRHSIALRRDGTVWSWGSHVFFQLGNGGTAPNTCDSGPCAISPVQVSGLTGIVAITAGGTHSLALRDNGTVYAWGNGTSGQLGNSASSSSNTPVQVVGVGGSGFLTNVVAVTAGGDHSLALRSDGSVVSWGSDSDGQLGNGPTNDGGSSNVPVVVTGLTNVITIAGGGSHSLALKDDGTVVAWGDDTDGQLGNGLPASDSDVFAAVSGLSTVVALAAGASHSLALKSDGTVSAWGLATPALLGNGGIAPNDCDAGAPVVPCAATPVSVSSLTNIVAITAGAAHNLAISHPADTTSVNASSASSTYGVASVALSATVTNTNGSAPVNEGTVTFTVKDGANATVGSPITSVTVSNGLSSVTFSLTGVAAATYSINVTYSGSTNFLSSIDTVGKGGARGYQAVQCWVW
jgi:alpha-tubulin suppressor-like RCC1 family protein